MAVREVDSATTLGEASNIDLHVETVVLDGDLADAPIGKLVHGGFGVADYVSDATPMPVKTRGAVARNTTGSAAAVAPAGTATVVTYVADSVFRCCGFLATGTTDGYFEVKYGATVKYFGRTHGAAQNFTLQLPAPDAEAASETVTIVVTNKGPVTGDYVAVLLGQ